MSHDKIFLLGVGCQKGGTTWLHSQLLKYENVNLGFCKEYHFFDRYYLQGKSSNFKLRWMKSIMKELVASPKGLPDKDALRHLFLAQNKDAYYHYFDYLHSKGEKTSLVGDITPAYSALKAEHFSIMKNKLEDLGFTIKVVFFMRDPVERIWSQIRMNKRKRSSVPFGKSDNDLILEKYRTPGTEARTRYDLTMLNLEKVFDKSSIFYCLYEDLFNEKSSQEITHFLELRENKFNVNAYENVSKKNQEIDILTQHKIANYYRKVYEFVGTRFSIEDHWPSVNLLSR